MPDKAKLFETVLMMNRIADYKDLTKRIFHFLNHCHDQLLQHPTFGIRDLMTMASLLVRESISLQ